MKTALIVSYFSWYENRIKLIREVLEEQYDVHCFTADYIHTAKKYIDEKNPELEYIHVPKYKKNISIARFWSYYVFAKQINKKLKELRPDIIYLVLPPNNTATYCLRYKKRNPETIYCVDIIDMWPESIPIDENIKKGLLFRVWGNMRNSSIKKCDHAFFECNLYREKLGALLDNDKSTTLYLTKKVSQEEEALVKEYIAKQNPPSASIALCYLGSINNLIDIDAIESLIHELVYAGRQVELKIIGDGETRYKFIDVSKKAGAHVSYYGKVYDQIEKIRLLGECDYGLNMMKDSVTVGLTIKSVDYFSMGLPIINTIQGDTELFVKEKEVGVNYHAGHEECIHTILNHNTNYRRNAFSLYLQEFSHEAFQSNVRDALLKIENK